MAGRSAKIEFNKTISEVAGGRVIGIEPSELDLSSSVVLAYAFDGLTMNGVESMSFDSSTCWLSVWVGVCFLCLRSHSQGALMILRFLTLFT